MQKKGVAMMSKVKTFARAIGEFFTALGQVKLSRRSAPALWTVIAAMIFLGTAQPTAYGLEFPMTTRLELPNSANLTSTNLTIKSGMPKVYLSSQLSEMAIVADISRQVEMARTVSGAKKVAKGLMKSQYSWGERQFECLNSLWKKESHWNYRAHNYRSGAHGIPQSLPASKMEVISDDWRTNPVTQIRWGLHYIDLRYDTPCRAWSKFQRSRYY
ncbi:MAG: hypothetical protein NTY85_05120 [Actinobacteria bacterium]|nr:hypothetical protein [Actinomycetota bacterium]